MAAPFGRLVKAWRRGGAPLAARVALDRLADAVLEWRLGIHSGGLVAIESLVAQWNGCHDYFPSSIRAFNRVLRDLQVREDDVFVDYGCGMGRALVLAARAPFGALVGFDVSEQLLAVARENLRRAVPTARRERIAVLHCDARAFRLPEAATVLYFYNPFHGEILAAVFADIARSLRARPRRLRVVFNNPSHFRQVEAQYPWLRVRMEYRFEYSIVVYEADAAALPAAAA
ncbi:MAG: class I SAM-dependent methyltransferase [Pseudomonadota bacterium]